MAANNLTLDEMSTLEKLHTPFVGGRTNVFLQHGERSPAAAGTTAYAGRAGKRRLVKSSAKRAKFALKAVHLGNK